MTFDYVDEETFQYKIIDVSNQLYATCNAIYKAYGDNELPIMVTKDGTLIFKLNKATSRLDRELGKNVFRVEVCETLEENVFDFKIKEIYENKN